MNIDKNNIPKFKNEDEERNFWVHEDSVKHIDWSKGQKVVLPALRPSLRSISLRLPESLLERIKLIASKRDVPYQSLIKIFLSEKVDEILHTSDPLLEKSPKICLDP